MKPARTAMAMLAAAALAACAGESGRINPDHIDTALRTDQSESWSRHLPRVFGGLMACLEAHPAQPAYAGDVVLQSRGMILVDVVGADRSRRECSTDTLGGTPPKLATATEQPLRGPAFTPASMPEPFQQCGSNDPVFHRDGKLLGWVTHFRENCHESGPAAQQNWRAFGTDPAWSVRVTEEAIIFDRFGQPPRQYPSKPPMEGSDRWTWLLESPDGAARNALELVILNTPCGDTMADRRFDFRAEAVVGGQRLRGCAEKLNLIP